MCSSDFICECEYKVHSSQKWILKSDHMTLEISHIVIIK
jgi:hypothetical protein